MGESTSEYGGVDFHRFKSRRKMDIQDVTLEVSTTPLFECAICNKKYRSKGALKKHLMNHTDQKNVFACHQCGKEFGFQYLLRRHEKIHSASKETHMCEICGATYSSTGALSDHKKFKHLNEGFQCSKCDKRFKNAYHLRRHNGTHEDEKAICKYCGGGGGGFRQLKNHEKICCRTLRQPTEKCEICGKNFLEKRYLTEHTKNKHSIMDIPCANCGKTFKNKKIFLKHKKNCTPVTEEL